MASIGLLVLTVVGTSSGQTHRLNEFPESFTERMHFPPDVQAIATAGERVVFPATHAKLEQGGLAGLEPMPARQLYLDAPRGGRGKILDTEQRRFDDPVTLLVSKFRYPWEDRHLDAIVWTTPEEDQALAGRLELRLKDEAGTVLARHVLQKLSASGLFFSLGFPEELRGRRASLEAVWYRNDRVVGRAEAGFHVREPAELARSARIPLHLLNEPRAHVANAPMTVGVPLPRGALLDENHVRLVDEHGAEVPLQTRTSARWSRFGSIKWLLCDFTADFQGEPRRLFLEYGPHVQRATEKPMAIREVKAGFPALDAGRIRISERGISFDPFGDGDHRPVLAPSALHGAFVRHENGKKFLVPHDVKHAVEELGSEKAVVRRTGWYVEPAGGERFCQFVTRIVFHRMSPIVRIHHTWIFTGDGNRDRIRDMGWRFAASGNVEPEGFLTSFTDGSWVSAESLVQFDYGAFALKGPGETRQGRTAGVLSARVGDSRVSLGAKDFWQNFPSELEFTADAFTFYNWPRHHPPASHESPIPRSRAFLHRFAHEGPLLDFRLPQEYTEGPIWAEATRSGRGGEAHWAESRPETVNAQGIARTEELFLYFTDRSASADQVARVLQGLNDETLRAVVDPAWVAASGVFGPIHHRDVEKYPEDEHVYEQVVHAPARWNERLGFYGMWLHGDVPAWDINLEGRTVSLYRAIRKNHHGWPVAWLPFARSGDPRLLKYAEAATRQMIDANFCHYASEDVDAAVGPEYFRRQGWWDRSLLPWAARNGPRLRNYTVDCDYIWHAYYLTGDARARDVALLFGVLTQQDYEVQRGPRTTNSTLTSYLDMYQATFDPWFLAAAHTIAGLHLHQGGVVHQEQRFDGVVDRLTPRTIGHFWRPADIEFHRFTGDDAYRTLALNHAVSTSSPWSYGYGGLWPRLSTPFIAQAAYAHALTGDTFHLARAAAYLDWAKMGIYDGGLEYARGALVQGGTARGIFTGYYIRQFPLALGALERAGHRPDPIPNPFYVQGATVPGDDDFHEFRMPEVLLRINGGGAVPLMLGSREDVDESAYAYELVGPDGRRRLSGRWPSGEDRLSLWVKTIEMPADAPEGIYRLILTGRVPLPSDAAQRSQIRRRHGHVLMPTAPPDVPEVMVFPRTENGTQVASGGPEIQYWFMVPRGVDEFWIDFSGAGSGLNRVSVWNPGGQRVWDRSYSGDAPARARIAVPPGDAGRLWRATGGRFVVDPQIPPYFSVSRAKWFDPEP
ncbi:MAG: hypothetical protein EA424_02895 [Planctomycetaceae bacterium]|nr:MAG: hypothetical protein EA424_02895 [Planctomycetaceae bacterium]